MNLIHNDVLKLKLKRHCTVSRSVTSISNDNITKRERFFNRTRGGRGSASEKFSRSLRFETFSIGLNMPDLGMSIADFLGCAVRKIIFLP